ncbi:hypothetical protein LJC61_03920 [Ruminococcaceae bacterium OttesenSCG-928-A16]|nr:hypothetical protein [Ruminococcaceae bacterium OttesenSCG-928-A16]
MKKERGLIDVPGFDPDEKVAFPPTEPEHRTKQQPPPAGVKPTGKPYDATYVPEWPTADPAQTTPGAPNIRNIDEAMPTEEELKRLSPDLTWHETPQTAPLKSGAGGSGAKPVSAGKSHTYNPAEKVAFPPLKPEDHEAVRPEGQTPPPAGKPYDETYVAEWPTTDPAQTTPGAPDIRNIDEAMPTEEELKRLSPDLTWHETPKTAPMKRDKKE